MKRPLGRGLTSSGISTFLNGKLPTMKTIGKCTKVPLRYYLLIIKSLPYLYFGMPSWSLVEIPKTVDRAVMKLLIVRDLFFCFRFVLYKYVRWCDPYESIYVSPLPFKGSVPKGYFGNHWVRNPITKPTLTGLS